MSTNTNIYEVVKETTKKFLINVARRVHKANRSLEFLSNCERFRVLPRYTFLRKDVIIAAKLSKERVQELRWEKLISSIKDEENRKIYNFNKFNFNISKLGLSDAMCKELKKEIILDVSKLELSRDNRRDHEFNKLIKYQKTEISKIKIINQTGVIIPPEVSDILQFGLNHSIGGKTRPLFLLSKFDSLFEHWSQYAQTQNLSQLEILSVRAKCFVIYDEMCKCSTNTAYTKKVKTFLDKNKLVLVPVDKSKNICLLTELDYENKIRSVFSDKRKFCLTDSETVSKNPTKIRILVRLLEPFVSQNEFLKMMPLEASKRSYGIVKCHKVNFPLRPIVSTVNSSVTGAEKYIQKILNPLKDICTFVVQSTKEFKSYFLKTREKFDPSIHQIMSIDAQKLYTSVNVEMVINEIVQIIYKSPKDFFKINPEEKTNLGFDTKIPPEHIFRTFLFQILIKYNYFSTVAGFYQQIDGLSMGSKISPLIANIYLNIMEQKIIKNEIKKGTIVSYCRFVDDIYCIVRKDQTNRILTSINKFDPQFLKFTHEEMKNNSLTFLDTEIYLNQENVPEIKKFRKESASDVIMNYNSISPKRYKLSTLKGDVFRCHHTCSTEEGLNKALDDLKELYVKNEYPKSLVDNIIREIKNKNFTNNGNRIKYQELKAEAPNQFYTLCIPYTSARCEKVSSSIYKGVKIKHLRRFKQKKIYQVILDTVYC